MYSNKRNGRAWATGCLLLACCRVAVASGDEDTVIGKWKIRINGGGEIYTAYLSLEGEDGILTGRYENEGRRSRIESAKLEGAKLTIVVNTQRFSTPVVATFTCDLEGGEMSGEVDFDSGSRSRSYDFTAKRISKPAIAASTASPNGDSAAQPRAVAQASDGTKQPAARGTRSFQMGIAGYDAMVDAEIWAIAPSKSLLRQGTMTTDGNNGGGESQVLMRFGEIFGAGARQVPAGSRIVSAKLTVTAFDPGTTCYVHRLLVPWTPAVTWDGMANGVSIDDVEASTVRDGFTFAEINMDKQSVEFDVTETVQKWSDGAANHGWVFVNTGSNGWDFYSSDWVEAGIRPKLELTYETRNSQEVLQ